MIGNDPGTGQELRGSPAQLRERQSWRSWIYHYGDSQYILRHKSSNNKFSFLNLSPYSAAVIAQQTMALQTELHRPNPL